MTSEKEGASFSLMILLVIAFGALTAAVYLYFPRQDRTVMPYELCGKWTCSDQRYKDRYLLIKKDWLYFGIGGQDFDLFKVLSVKKIPEPMRTLYVVHYQNVEMGYLSLSVYYDSEDRSLRFKNQTEIAWTK